ncbi:MAG: amino acid adenylation domain-containing protein, partial [Lysobacteraceae bacterium]
MVHAAPAGHRQVRQGGRMSNALKSPPAEEVDYDPFARAALERVVPITEPQREIWLADKLGRDASLAYNESVSLRLRGPLDVDALDRAVRALAERHELLRATISPTGNELCIAEQPTLRLDRHDLSLLDAATRDAAMADRLRAAVDTPFNLEQGPLFRVELLALGQDDHLLLLNAHHIVCDGWSFGLLVRDIADGYAEALGEPATPVAADSFAAYVDAEAAWAQGDAAREDERYWLSRFPDIAPSLDLPLDRPRPRQRSFVSAREDAMLDADLVAELRRLGARHGASLFATLFTGFATLLRRLSGQGDVVVGIAAAGQSAAGHDNVVGHCVNILPVRVEAAPGIAFGAVLEESSGRLLDAFEHQRHTFGTLLKKVSIPRDPSRLPMVSVLFNLDQPLDASRVRFPGLDFECTSNPRTHEGFELFVNAVPVEGGLRLECQYNRDLFDAGSVRRWLHSLQALLRAAVADPAMAWDRLDWLAAEDLQALAELQPAPLPYDPTLPVHQRFVANAALDPGKTALVFGARSISYGELDRRSNAIAHALRERGVGAGALVGICLEREPDLYAAVLGVLKSGAGFVPLDPTYPAERLDFMAADASLACLVCTQALLGTVDVPRARTLALDVDLDAAAWARGEPLPPADTAATPASTAYVIYTSGSTGKPKGVVIPHGALVNVLCSMQREPGLSADDRLVAVTTMSFDVSMPELFLPLMVGARVIVASRDDVRDGRALRRLLEQGDATIMQATPSGWRLLLDAGWPGRKGFRALAGGEPLPPELASELLRRCDELWNMYGPTETTVWSTCARVREPERGVSIGRPMANTSVWILDEAGTPCPIGIPGEIWIGGDGVADGYLNRPDLTAERFLPDPRSKRPGARMYRTGDRGRWRNDGTLEHLGRLDFQVKVRGYRIELGEIESNLARHPDVVQCVVVAREDRPGDIRLVAYVVAATAPADEALEERALRDHLRVALPEHMVPQRIVFLPAIPLTPNGKIDRKSLPAPGYALQSAALPAPPRNDLERAVAKAMAEVLALPEVGIHDDFFAMGGHSLLAAQLTSRLNREHGVALSLRALFDCPTVERLAAIIGHDDAHQDIAHIPARPNQARAPLSLLQERLWMLEQYNPGQLSYNTPSAHRLTGPLDIAAFDAAFRAMMQRQSVLRTTIGVEEGEPVQVIHDRLDPGLRVVEDLTALPLEERMSEVGRRIREMIEMPFADLSVGPLFRARLFRLAVDEHVLFFMPHHVIWDGWSFDLLYNELSELYAAAVEGRAAVLPELPVSYGDWAAWHRGWLQGPQYAAQLTFWRNRLANLTALGEPPRALPTDKPRKRGMSGNSRSCPVLVPRDLLARVQATSRALEVTNYITLLTAYFVLLHGVSGRHALVVGTPVRGRNSAEVEDLMGDFTNLLPLWVSIDPEARFTDGVRRVREIVLDSFANPDVRMEDLTRELALGSDGGGKLLYQALFSFQDIRRRVQAWGKLRHARVEAFQPGATEDLGLWFIEDAENLTGGLIYNAEILHDDTVELLRARYLRMLEAIAANPHASIRELVDFQDGQPRLIG